MTPIGTMNAAIAPLSEDIQQLQSYSGTCNYFHVIKQVLLVNTILLMSYSH